MSKKIREVMTADVQVVPPDCTLETAAQKMRDFDVGGLPVCDGERLIGLITDRDIVIRAVADGRDVKTCKAQDVMSSPVVYCFEDQDVEEVARIMETQQIRRLAVLNSSKRLVGIVSLGDVAVQTGREDLAGEILEKVSESIHFTNAPH